MTDPYLDTDICVARLFAEWRKHPRLVVACDFDSTVFPWEEGHAHDKLLALVRRAQSHGFYIVIFTASVPERYPMMHIYLKDKGIRIDSINVNPIELPYGKWGKVYYNVLLDDRSGLNQACEILEKTLDLIDAGAQTQTL